MALAGGFDVIVLDLGLPRLDGLDVCARLRAAGQTLPVLMLTARDGLDDKLAGFDRGADDYLVKPFSIPELIARIRALLRRAAPSRMSNVVVVGDVELDRNARRVRRAGADIHLGPTEFKLLEFLISHPGRVYSRESLLNNVWGTDVFIDDRTVDVHVGRLRRVLNRGRKPDPIRTVRGSGYAFDERFGR